MFVVVGGSGRMKLDDEIVEVKKWDVVRVPSGTWRGYEAGPEGLEILVFGAPNLGANPREDVEGQRDWWLTERRSVDGQRFPPQYRERAPIVDHPAAAPSGPTLPLI